MGTTAAAMGTTAVVMGTAAAALRESMNPTCMSDTCRTLSPHVRLERHGACVQDHRNVSALLQHGPSCSTACPKPLLLGLAPPGERFSSPPPRSMRAPALFRAELPMKAQASPSFLCSARLLFCLTHLLHSLLRSLPGHAAAGHRARYSVRPESGSLNRFPWAYPSHVAASPVMLPESGFLNCRVPTYC